MDVKQKRSKILDFILYRKDQGIWLSSEHMEMVTKMLEFEVSPLPMNLDSSIEFQVKDINEAYEIVKGVSNLKEPIVLLNNLRSKLEALDMDPSQSFYLIIKRTFRKEDLFHS